MRGTWRQHIGTRTQANGPSRAAQHHMSSIEIRAHMAVVAPNAKEVNIQRPVCHTARDLDQIKAKAHGKDVLNHRACI